jgi:hypothetical protein
MRRPNQANRCVLHAGTGRDGWQKRAKPGSTSFRYCLRACTTKGLEVTPTHPIVGDKNNSLFHRARTAHFAQRRKCARSCSATAIGIIGHFEGCSRFGFARLQLRRVQAQTRRNRVIADLARSWERDRTPHEAASESPRFPTGGSSRRLF